MIDMEDKLRELQITQLEILEYVDEFCKKHEIKYSLYAGTLLGAVRHKGFIPWDDDLDICMSRDDYNRFIELWDNEIHEKFLLQNKENTPSFTQSFTKIRKKNTLFIQEDDLDKDYSKGIFIDIFPIDRIPNGNFNKKLFQLKCMIYQLMMREFIPKNSNIFVRIVCKFLLMFTNKHNRIKIRNKLLNSIITNNHNHLLNTVMIETVNTARKEFSNELLDDYCELEFEEKTFMCFAMWKHYLENKYGNYRELPPVEERMWKHKPVLIDFGEK